MCECVVCACDIVVEVVVLAVRMGALVIQVM